MKKLRVAVLGLLAILVPIGVLAQFGPSGVGPFYQPGWYQGLVPTPQQWATMWSNKADYFPGGQPIQFGGTGATTKAGAAANLGLLTSVLPDGSIFVGNTLNAAAPVAPSGDLTMTDAGAFSVNHLSHVTDGSLANAGLAHPSATVNGVTCTLGSPCTIVAAAASIAVGTTTITGGTPNGLLYDAAGAAGNLATANSGVLVTSAGGVPSISTTLPSGLAMGTPASLTLTNALGLPLAGMVAEAANTVVGNATSGSASPTALAVGSCSTASSALSWLTNSGFGCNTAINAATLGGATFASPGPIGGTTPGSGAFTSVTATGSYAAQTGTAPPAGGAANTGYCLSSTSGLCVSSGTGAPTFSAPKGSIYMRVDNGAIYSNTSGSTTWIQLTAGGVSITGTPSANQLATWNSSSAIQGLASANNSVLSTDGSGVPSWGTALPTGTTAATGSALAGGTNVATQAYADAAVAVGIPIGGCIPYSGSSAPTGWALAAGQTFLRSSPLFAVAGTTYGVGNGSTTANMPDLRGSAAIGKDNMTGTPANRVTTAGSGIDGATLGATGGAQNHAHSVSVTVSTTGSNTTGAPTDGQVVDSGNLTNVSVASINHVHNVSIASSGTGSGSAATSANMPPTVIMNYICKIQ
ncbi:MAG: hypothetical protein QOJ15_3179 [Bradyrhizobium sp.]|jgi:hypothetical protein|nr:hypothetical protein [Bradyrhizobium sp.]